MFLLPLHRLTSQYLFVLKTIANHRAYGITPSMIRLAFIPNPVPQVDVDILVRIKISVWNLTCS
jgi:hypothetical protein